MTIVSRAVCICPRTCDCQNPDFEGGLSNHCPEHNFRPLPLNRCAAQKHWWEARKNKREHDLRTEEEKTRDAVCEIQDMLEAAPPASRIDLVHRLREYASRLMYGVDVERDDL